MRVSNMKSPRSGQPVANQYMIEDGDKVYFQSYQTTIAKWDKEERELTLDRDSWDYSVTTLKYLKEFMQEVTVYRRMSKAEIAEQIKSGELKVENLN